MNDQPIIIDGPRQGGFILITSLIFLVVITLFVISALQSSTMQQQMAANLRDQSRARQAADAALRQGEQLLANPAFDTYHAPGDTVTLQSSSTESSTSIVASTTTSSSTSSTNTSSTTTNTSTGIEGNAKLWVTADIPGYSLATQSQTTDANKPFLNHVDWHKARAYTADSDMGAVYYYIDHQRFIPRDLNPDTAARARGAEIYRITAHAAGEGPAGQAMTQSLYARHY